MRKVILYVLLFLFIAAAYLGWKIFGPATTVLEEKYFFYIHTGETYDQVKDSLVAQKVLPNATWFDRVATYLHYNKNVKPGKYKIEDGMSLSTLVRMLRAGKQSPVNLVITKIRTKEDFAKKLGDNFETDSLEVIQFLNSSDSLSEYKLDSNTVMTGIIPNTYSITWNTPVSKIFKKLFSEHEKFWNTTRRQQAFALHLSEAEVYILASIVEEETNKDEDKGKIASVYINRMNKGMKLAADPTVKFAMHDFSLKRIYYKYLSYPSPYNTYIIQGLPPGPICTPSIKTIDAVLTSPITNYLYFVARPGLSGYSDFTDNFEQHEKNAKVYQHWLDSTYLAKQQKDSINNLRK